MVTKKPPDKLVRTISCRIPFNHYTHNILKFMTHESKNIYNTTIFHTEIFNTYQDNIFKKLYYLVQSKNIRNISQFDSQFYKIYDQYYHHYLFIKPFKQFNNNIIYKFIKNELKNINIINDNFYVIEKFVINHLLKMNVLKFPKNPSIETKNEIFYDIVHSILKSIYLKNFNETKDDIIHHKKCKINNNIFIGQVKNNKCLFEDKKDKSYKSILKEHRLFKNLSKKEGIKSNQNYIARIIYRYYTNPKIPSDLMCNIIAKAYKSYSSFFALRVKGLKANHPNFLPKNGSYILPFFARSRKEIIINNKKYYRLTVGSSIAEGYVKIIDDDHYVCINSLKYSKFYVHRDRLIKIPKNVRITKRDNYIINGYYIPKNSENIINAFYLNLPKPYVLDKYKLVLIEINSVHYGHQFNVNYTYEINKSDNKPLEKKYISMDFGINNLATIYDPNGEQFIINGKNVTNINNFYNNIININKSLLSKNKKTKRSPRDILIKNIDQWINYINGKSNYVLKRITNKDQYKQMIVEQKESLNSNTKVIKKESQTSSKYNYELLTKRKNKIEDYFNKIVKWITEKYKDCKYIIVGYNEGWKNKVNMGRTMNGIFYQIPYRKLIKKLKDKLELNNQELVVINESYTSKCDALAMEEIGKHETYLGKRIKRGLFSSSTGVLINADINGAINIMRKWEKKQGIRRTQITGEKLLNPKRINIHEALKKASG